MNKKSLLILLSLLGISFLLSARMILAGDFYFLADNARDMLLARDIVLNKEVTLIGTHSGLGGLFHGPIWLYLLTPFFVLGGGDPFSFVYLYLLIPLSTVLLAYFVGKRIGGESVGLFLAFFVAISKYIWESVPLTISINLMPLIFLLLVYFLYKFINGDKRAFILVSFLAGLTLQFETALPIMLVPAIAVIFVLKINPIKNPKIVLLSILSYVLAISNFIIFDLRHNFLMTNAVLRFITGGEKNSGYLELIPRVKEHLMTLTNLYQSLLPIQTLTITSLFLVTIFLFIFSYKKWKNSRQILWMLIFPLIVFSFFLAYPYPIYREYIYGLMIPIALGIALVLSNLLKTEKGKVVIGLFLMLTILQVAGTLFQKYLTSYPQDLSAGSYKNQKEVADWVSTDAKGKVLNYFVYTPETFTYGMDYLMWWEGKTKGIVAQSQKQGDFYLILYPPVKNDLSAHEFWKKNVINIKSEPSLTKKFPGNIIVEKFMAGPNEKPVESTYYQNLIFR